MAPFIMNPFRFSSGGSVGSWKELDRNILLSPNTEIDITGLPTKQYYMVIRHTLGRNASISSNGGYELNADGGANYAIRRAYIGDTGSTDVNFNDLDLWDTNNDQNFAVEYFSNVTGQEKLFYSQNLNSNVGGSSTAPFPVGITGKWANTTDAINQITLKTLSVQTWNTGSQVIVLGYDPTDTHTDTDNFWQELASVDLSGGTADDINSGTFAAKNYLCVQTFMELDGGVNTITGNCTFNGDTGTLYSRSRSNNGAARSSGTDETSIDVRGGESKNRFDTMYISNRTVKEKLVNGNLIAAGSGASTAPDSTIYGAKWDNSAAQVTQINFENIDALGSYGVNSFMKVWGHD